MTEFHKAPDGNPERFKKYPNGFKKTGTFFSKEKGESSLTVKLIASDMDDTLLNSNTKLSERNQSGMRRPFIKPLPKALSL